MAHRELFAYIAVKGAAEAMTFYASVFDAIEKFRLTEPSGRIGHAEMDFGGPTLMISDEFPEYGIAGPKPDGPTAVTLHLHVDNCDEIIARAVKAGARLERAPQDQFYGERSGSFYDPFGHRWLVGHTIEEVTPEEMQRRYTEMMNSEQK
jgi:PhnB protein